MEFNVLAISSLHPENRIFEDYCRGIQVNSGGRYHFVDYMDLYLREGQLETEKHIEKLVVDDNINLIFFILRSGDLTFDVNFMERLSRQAFIAMNFFDTEYYFEPVDRYYAQVADLVMLPDYLSKFRYELLNIGAISTFSLFDKNCYKVLNVEKKGIDVSFVGNLATANRKEYVDFISGHGIGIETFGANTAHGFVTFERMVEIFNDSRINVNFTGTMSKSTWYGSMYGLRINQRIRQCKGRPIEIALCGGFVLTEYAPGIDKMFEIGKEIDVFRTKGELLDKIRYYLENPQIRQEMAMRAYERAVRDYDCVSGFSRVFSMISELQRGEKTLFFDKDFEKRFASYRFFYIPFFVLTGRFLQLFQEIGLLFRLRRFRISYAYNYMLKGTALYMNRHPSLKRKLMGFLGIPYRN